MPLRKSHIYRMVTVIPVAIILIGVAYSFIWASSSADFGFPYNLSHIAADGKRAGNPTLVAQNGLAAVVWSEGYNTAADTKANGSILLTVADETAGYWLAKTTVFTADNNNWAVDPTVIFDRDPSTPAVHLLWAQANSCGGVQTNCKYESVYYDRCTIAGDSITCETPVKIANLDDTAYTNVAFRSPTLVQDDTGNLHAVWTDETNNKVFYNRGIAPFATGNWSAPQEVSAAQNGKTPKLAFSNGHIHLVWKDNSDKKIKYLYDNIPGDNILTGVTHSFDLPSGYIEARNPTIAALGNIVYVAFDLQKENTDNTFALVHARSTNNGNDWVPILKDIPGQHEPSNYSSYISNTDDQTQGLQPQLVLTATSGITHLNAVWHDLSSVTEEKDVFQIHHTWVNVDPSDAFDQPWVTPIVNATPGQYDDIAPSFAAGDNGLHLAYLERTGTGSPWDAMYRGFIAGTIDPAYLATDVTLTHTVSPTVIITTANPAAPTRLIYTVNVSNTGNVTAQQTHITQHLPAIIDTVSVQPNTFYDSTNRKLDWQVNIAPHSAMQFIITATTTNIDVPYTAAATATVWSDTYSNTVPLSATVQTQIVTPATVLKLEKTVSPRYVVTTATTLPATDLQYTIKLSNLTQQTLTNLKLTDPLSDSWWGYIDPNPPTLTCNQDTCGTITVDGDDYDIINWTGHLAPADTVTIQFTMHNNVGSNPPPIHPITNTVQLVNPANDDVLLTQSAVTGFGAMHIYLPLVIK